MTYKRYNQGVKGGDTMKMGKRIAEARKERSMTQEELADRVGVSFQAVSTWERDENVPDTKHLKVLSEVLGVSLDSLMSEHSRSWTLREKLFDETHMYTYVKTRAQSLSLRQTLAALPLVRAQHKGQLRDGPGSVPYIVHPLTMACHALAMGIEEDDVLAALLLHDVVEDTGAALEALPVGETVREAVRLVSYNSYPGPKEQIKPLYYENIGRNPLACLVKCIDRCCNLSTMAMGFSREKMVTYVEQTEEYLLPLLAVVKNEPRWNNAAWLLQYQITALLETCKRLL